MPEWAGVAGSPVLGATPILLGGEARRVSGGVPCPKRLATGASKIIVAKGKQVDEFKGGDPAALPLMLGSTGNLRAPTLRVGTTLLVGFNEEIYRTHLS